jgi:hypothetical protein
MVGASCHGEVTGHDAVLAKNLHELVHLAENVRVLGVELLD